MASFAPIRGTKAAVAATPLIDGQFLIETDQGNQNKIWVDSYDNGTLKRSMAGGGGHEILPTIDPAESDYPPNENKVVRDVNSATASSDKINSLYGTQMWSNEFTKRFIVEGTSGQIESSGIGTFPEDEDADVVQVTPVGTENPSTEGWYEIDFTNNPPIYIQSTDVTVDMDKKYFSQIIDEQDWLPLDILKTINETNPVSGLDSDNLSLSLKFDPATKEPIVLGGYIIDTDTGNICIKFGNSIEDTEHARVAIDITYTRNQCSVIS